MSVIRAVCLSDLHLGADNSLLTSLEPSGRTSPLETPAILSALGIALRALVEGQAEPPTLILNGDVLEQALAPTRDAAMAFDRFIEALYPQDQPARFSDRILYLPGNHDHHQWQEARDALTERTLLGVPVGQPMPQPPATVSPDQDAGVRARFLTNLVRRHRGLHQATVTQSYPELGLRFQGGRRAVVFHHGHYLESIYRVISEIRDLLFPGQRVPETVEDLEEENGPWIDFFWSMLGRSGVAGRDVNLLYKSVQDPDSSRALAHALARAVAQQTKESAAVDWVEEKVLDLVFRWLLSRAARAAVGERDKVLSDDDAAGLSWYLGGPLREALRPSGLPESLAFVFGHTHQAFSMPYDIDGWERPVEVMNTGGWVIDSEQPSEVIGGSAVLIDEQGDIVNLRIYNVRPDRAPAPVYAEAVGSGSAPFQEAVTRRLDQHAGHWRVLSELIANDIPRREQILLEQDERTARALDR